MIVGVPKESYPGERRVALVPAVIPTLAKAGLEVIVESGAGEQAGYPDSAYAEKGGKILPDRAAVFASADIIVQVLCYGSNDVTGQADLPLLRRDQLLIGFLRPFGSADVTQHGRAFLHGDDLRLQSRPAGGGNVHQNLSHDDDGRGYDHAGAGIRHRCRSGGIASYFHGSAAGRGGFCL